MIIMPYVNRMDSPGNGWEEIYAGVSRVGGSMMLVLDCINKSNILSSLFDQLPLSVLCQVLCLLNI